ncbi:hypothetical protein BIW11_00898 [Tropilaelaps mercedesae]|uniref:Uncharacterized protein n=1 Tax=Tropilaelaps mercedesae TaxID=418985 RepID=A0A1V9XMZ1_9ACAR|nr:hypothetical protein BIW11_00898 [Tropilaelaps mercedesae]
MTQSPSELDPSEFEGHIRAVAFNQAGPSGSTALDECSGTSRRNGSRRNVRYPPLGGSCFRRCKIDKRCGKSRSSSSQAGVLASSRKCNLLSSDADASPMKSASSFDATSACFADLAGVQMNPCDEEFYLVVTAPTGEVRAIYGGQPVECVEGVAAEGVVPLLDATDTPVFVGDPLDEHFYPVNSCSGGNVDVLADSAIGGGYASFENFDDIGSSIANIPVDVAAGFGDQNGQALGEGSKPMLLLRPGDSLLKSSWTL